MTVGWETYLERLGPQGLRLVLAGLLDDVAVDQLLGRPAEAGIDRVRALADLVGEKPELTGALLEALDAAATAADGGAGWDESRIREELADKLHSPDLASARILHRLARSSRPPLPPAEIRAAAEVLAAGVVGDASATRPKFLARSASDRSELRELEQERRELEARLRQLEAREARLVDRSADFERQLARRVAEIHQLRLGERTGQQERARLQREVARLEKRIDEFKERRAREGTGVIATALRRLTTENRRAAARLDKLVGTEAERRDASREQARRLQALEDAVEKLLVQRDAEARANAAAQEAILRELAALRPESAAGDADAGKSVRRSHAAEGEPRVALFVDVQNMFYGAREKNARLDFEALLAVVSAGRRLVRAVAYLVETRDIDQTAFIHLLQVKKYEVKRKPLRVRPDGSMKGNWDLEMALDVLTTAERVDAVVLVTGDGDFVPLVRQLQQRGLRVEVYGFPRSTAPDLREAADRFVAVSRKLLRPLAPARRARPAGARTERAGPATPAPAAKDKDNVVTEPAPAEA